MRQAGQEAPDVHYYCDEVVLSSLWSSPRDISSVARTTVDAAHVCMNALPVTVSQSWDSCFPMTVFR